MKRALFLLILLIPCLAWGYQDHRGRNLDSLERVAARYTPDRLATASAEEKEAYARLCLERSGKADLELRLLKDDHYEKI